jgi:hypothetical protein
MWADTFHGVVNVQELLAGTVERAQPGAARVHESLVNVE